MMALYRSSPPASTVWPKALAADLESRFGRQPQVARGSHRPDISPPLRRVIAGLVGLAGDRPYGLITRLAGSLATSRQTIYDIANSVAASDEADPVPVAEVRLRPADRNAAARSALTLLVVGAMQLRAVQWCLEALLSHERSIGWLSGLVDEAGTRAGAVLAAADWSSAQRLILSRDELYTGDLAWLLTTDTASHAIVSGHVETVVAAETWAVSLALDALKTGGRIEALVEDAAKFYPSSVRLAEELLGQPFRPDVRKDHWHLLRQAGRTLHEADRLAFHHLDIAERKASRVPAGLMHIRDFDGWEEAHAQAERAIAAADTIRVVVALLGEVLGLVDRRTGQILDRATVEWYLAAMIEALRRTDSRPAAGLAGTIDRQASQLLSFHDRLAQALKIWRRTALAHFDDLAIVSLFETTVARAWHRERAVTNGQRQYRGSAGRAADQVQALCQADPEALRLAEDLHDLLDGTVRTSSASENVNSILRAYVWGHRHFRDRRTAQNWLNLLVLWYNLHVFERGKRAGHSPFDLAGVTIHGPDGQPTRDWLVALGYSA
jgi:hypothetical protein